VTDDGGVEYLYDGDGRICAVSNYRIPFMTIMTGYLYDAEGRRVSKGTISAWSCDPVLNGFQPTDDHILDLAGEQVTEMGVGGTSDGSTTSGLVWHHTNVWAAGKLLATYDGDSATTSGLHFYFNDPLGTRRVQTDLAGNIEQKCSSLPFGDGETCGPTPTENLFTGKERDQESGNDYFGARYYSSSMGRFMSPDWSAKEDPVPYAHLDDPQSLNLYSYVENNPLFKADLDGHGCPPDCSTGNDVVDFVNGLTNAWGSDNVLGAGRNNQSTYAGQLGQAFGDFGAAAQGGYETLLGVGGDIVGGGLDATGVGAIAGVPINVVSTAAAIHGTATGTEGATHLAMALAKPASGKGSVPKEQRAKPRTATDKERTEMRKEQGGNCAHCDKPLGDEPGVSHHDPVRHSDGGTEQKLVHEACHQELHGKC
jgi:RHS repeat-associated protein